MKALSLVVLLVLISVLPCRGQTTWIDAPTTVSVLDEAEDHVGLLGATLFVRPKADSVYVDHGSPVVLQGTGQLTVLGAIAIDESRRKVYVGTLGAGGLYSCTIGDNNWDNISPPEGGTHVSALHVDPTADVLLAGTGGYAASSSIDAKGIFRSTDGGETWRRLPSFYPQNTNPGIRDISLLNDGTVVVSARTLGGQLRGGVWYLKEGETDWVWVTSAEPTELVSSGDRVAWKSGDYLSWLVEDGDGFDDQTLFSAGECTHIKRWSDSSFVLANDQGEGLSFREVRLSGDTLHIGSMVLPPGRQRVVIGTSESDAIPSIELVGRGLHVAMESDLSRTRDISLTRNAPLVVDLASTREGTILNILGHGWYNVDQRGIAMRSSDETLQNGDWQIVQSATIDGDVVAKDNDSFVRVGKQSLDTILENARDHVDVGDIEAVCLLDADTTLFISNGKAFYYVETTDVTLEIESSLWPRAGTGDTPLTAAFVNRSGKTIVAWADGQYRQSGSNQAAGLYALEDLQWRPVLLDSLRQRGSLTYVDRNQKRFVFASRQEFAGAQFTNELLSTVNSDLTGATVVTTGKEFGNSLSGLVIDEDDRIRSSTLNAQLFEHSVSGEHWQTNEFGVLTHLRLLGTRAISASRQGGVLLIDFDDGITSIGEPSGVIPEATKILVSPHPVEDHCAVSLSSNDPIISVVVYSMDGAVVQRVSVNNAETILLISLSELPPGVYLLACHTKRGRASTRSFMIH